MQRGEETHMSQQLTAEKRDPQLSSADAREMLGNPNRFISDRVAEQITGIPVATLRRWRYEGRGPRYVKIGSSVRYNVTWLLDFLMERVVETRDSKQPHAAN